MAIFLTRCIKDSSCEEVFKLSYVNNLKSLSYYFRSYATLPSSVFPIQYYDTPLGLCVQSFRFSELEFRLRGFLN